MLPAEELERLAADIAENGLRHPVVLDREGRVLDGRNRLAACEIAGVTAETVTYEGDDLAAFVLSANVARRHLTTGQQAMSTALVLSDDGKRVDGRWKRGSIDIGESSNISAWRKQMDQAGQILDHAPELADNVVAGSLALDAAFREADKRRDSERQSLAEVERMQDEEQQSRRRLTEFAPEYMTALDNGVYRSARQAFTAWEDDNRKEAARLRREQADAENAAKEHWAKHCDLYGGIAAAITTLAAFAGRDALDLMAEYRAGMLPPNDDRRFTENGIGDALTTVTNLLEWRTSHATQ